MKILLLLFICLFMFSCDKDGSKNSPIQINEIPTDNGTDFAISTLDINSVTLPVDGTYGEGATLVFQLHYSDNITVQGNPSLELTIAGETREANFVSGSETKVLEFNYIIDAPDHDLDGISISNTLKFNGASLETIDGTQISRNLNISDTNLNTILIDTSSIPPESISTLTTAPSTTSGTLNVSWNVPNSGDAILNYSLQYRKKGLQAWNEVSPRPTLNSTSLSGLEANIDYEIRVAANNGVLGNYSTIQEAFIFDLMELNPIAWLDATDPNGDGSLPDDGSLISTWVDKTGMATNASEEDTARQPYLKHNAFNGLPAVRFESLAQGLEGGFARTNNGGLTIFLVAKMDSVLPRRAFFEFYQEGSPNSGASSRRGFFFTYGFNEASDNFGLDNSQLNLWSAYDDGYFTSMWENGVNVFTNNPNHFGSTEFSGNGIYILGDDKTGGDAINAYIAEFLIFDRALSPEDTALIENYLNNKWGL